MLTVRTIPAGTVGFDTATKLTASLAAKFRSIGYHFVIRPVTIGIDADPGDLDKTEMQVITAAGLGLVWYQHVRDPGWVPSTALGKEDAAHAVAHAIAAGIPAGVTGACDLEGVDENCGLTGIMDYLQAWHDEVASAGYVPALYEGVDCGLDSTELAQTPFDRIWKSCSTVPDVTGRGWCMIQTRCDFGVFEIDIDRDEVQANNNGELPTMLVDCEAYLAAIELEMAQG